MVAATTVNTVIHIMMHGPEHKRHRGLYAGMNFLWLGLKGCALKGRAKTGNMQGGGTTVQVGATRPYNSDPDGQDPERESKQERSLPE